VSCGVGHRHGSDMALLWLWCRLAAVPRIRTLAWDSPCAVGEALKKQTNKKKNKKKEKKKQKFPTNKSPGPDGFTGEF